MPYSYKYHLNPFSFKRTQLLR